VSLFIESLHPNANLLGEFCIPSQMINFEIGSILKKNIENILTTYNFNDCYFKPTEEDIKYEEIKPEF